MYNKVLFINADREYAEGKNQNKLRPEDIEKINFVFTHKLEIPKYSRLVDKTEIVEEHDYNLNIRRYVDNTPDPEPEDVQAHLIGGIPKAEVIDKKTVFAQFGLTEKTLFQSERPGYLKFRDKIGSKAAIKTILESHSSLQKTFADHHQVLEDWWKVVRDDFAQLRGEKKMPEVRQELLTGLKEKLIPLRVLDEFRSAGVFVNWWQNIRYDLKTIVSTGWHHTLISDEDLSQDCLPTENEEIEKLESQISEVQNELSEAIENAQTISGYQPEEEEKTTASVIRKALKELIDDLKDSKKKSAQKEREKYQEEDTKIKNIEEQIKNDKGAIKTKTDELTLKLQLKRLGGEEYKRENSELLRQVEEQRKGLDPKNKTDKKKITLLDKDKKTLQERIDKTDDLLEEIGDSLSEDEAKQLILKKLYDLINNELNRYLNTEKRALINIMENFWDKYAVSRKNLEAEQTETLKELDEFLSGLGYLG